MALELTGIHPTTVLSYLTCKALMIYPPQATVMRMHGRDVSYVVIFIPETADLPACSVGSFTQDAHSSRKGLTNMRTVFVAPVVGNLKKGKGTNGTQN